MFSRRTVLSVSAVAAAAGVLAPPPASATTAPRLTTWIGGTRVARRQVLEWEARRLHVAAQRIAGSVPGWLTGDLSALVLRPAASIADVARDRQLLADAKLRLGEAEMRAITSLDLTLSNPIAQLTAAPGRWAISRTRISSNRGTAAGFVEWFNGRIAANDVRAMLVACPDHYVITSPAPHRQDVIEVTGGAILASQFLIDYTDAAALPIATDPRCAARAAGWARNANGARVGAVHHQFRDHAHGGFTGELAIAFPAFLPPFMISEHRWHLACEFSNWITAYVQA